MRRRAISTSPSSPTHVTIKSSAGHSILKLVRGSQCPTEKSSGAVAIRPGTALSSSALVATFFATCHLGEDRFSSPSLPSTSQTDPALTQCTGPLTVIEYFHAHSKPNSREQLLRR